MTGAPAEAPILRHNASTFAQRLGGTGFAAAGSRRFVDTSF